jgi:hypothetical protein
MTKQEVEQRSCAENVIGPRRTQEEITEDLDHLEDLEHRINNQQQLKKKKDLKEKHHLEYPLHLGIKLFLLVYVIHVTILVRKLQTVEPMPRIETTMRAIQTTCISESHMKHRTSITTILIH